MSGEDAMERKPRVTVDHDLCIGNAMCRAAAPRAFVEDSEGQSVVANPEQETLAALLEAVASCPTGAVVVEDAETGEILEP